jgi:acyl-CoA thioester hydrolase
MELRHASKSWIAASCEHLALHVDMETRKVTPFPDDILRNLAVMKAAHARLARPSSLGRVIGVPGRMEMPDAIQATGTRH